MLNLAPVASPRPVASDVRVSADGVAVGASKGIHHLKGIKKTAFGSVR